MGNWNSLQARFTRLVIAAAGGFALLAAVLGFQLAYRHAISTARTTLDGLVATVERTTAIAAYTSDRVLLQEIVDGLKRNPLVGQVEVVTNSGVRIAREDASTTSVATTDLEVRRVLPSPFDANEGVALLRVVADNEKLREGARGEALKLSCLMAVQVALIAAILNFAAGRFVARPITRLARSLNAMAPGSTERVPLPRRHSRDEIGTLVTSANSLLSVNQHALDRERSLRAEVEAIQLQYQEIFDSSSAGIFVLDREGRLINGNPTVMKVIGAPMQELQELQGKDFVRSVFSHPDKVLLMIEDAIERRETIAADLELISRGNELKWVHCLISVQSRGAKSDQGAQVIEGVLYDVTERRRAERAIRDRADTDIITGLKNRAACETAIDGCIARLGSDDQLAVLFIDLDGFKGVNDRHGHEAGDRVLKACAERILATVRRSNDVVARIGGDEFVVVLNHMGAEDLVLVQVAARIVESLQQPITWADGSASVQIGSSIGIACYPLHGTTRPELLQAADEAMYQVKRHGKNCYAMALRQQAPPPPDFLVSQEWRPTFSNS